MTKERYLHFTLGPVQSFVGQARRTRDYWAGSFILAYLTGHAMAAVLEKGKIIYPSVMGEGGTDKDPLLAAIMEVKEKGRCQAGPRIATLPNRFMAQVPGDFEPVLCTAAVKGAWRRIAAVVWDRFVAPVEGLGHGVKEIWDRQVENFWDISWVLADTDKEVDILDRRKNWRSHVPTVEPGDKCTLLGNYQELSGFVRVRPKERERQDEFWQCLRGLRDRLAWYELRPDERLCAISLIKRLFPRVSVEAIGWPVEESFPSTTMMAAVHWMEKIATTETELAITFAQEALRIPDVRRQSYRQIPSLARIARDTPQLADFLSLEANCFYPSVLENDNIWPSNTREIREKLSKMLGDFSHTPSPFYALLLMDGDQMGKLLRDNIDRRDEISAALNQFAHRVDALVQEADGVTIYAGGDDVFALAPLEGALSLAAVLHEAYIESFQNRAGIPATISGALIFAHFNAPLRRLFQEAHRLLDEVAKGQKGRDSLVVTVWKTGGPVLTWAAPWGVLREKSGTKTIIEELREDLSDPEKGKGYSSSFFYNMRHRFSVLEKEHGLDTKGVDPVKLLTAEYLKSREREVTVEVAEERIKKLLRACYPARRAEDGEIKKEKRLQVDGALLARFLAANWEEV